MAWRWEKEDNGEYAIVIDGFDGGISPDPQKGMTRILSGNLNIPGEISVGYPATASTVSGATLGDPIAGSQRWFGYTSPGAPSGSIQSWAVLDSTGQVFETTSITGTWTYLSSSASTTGASGNDGLAYWMGYLFKTRGANLDYWDGSSWTNAWQSTLTASCKHFMYVGTDNVLYITNRNFIATLRLADPSAPTSFAPGTASTYTFTVNKLQLPATDEAISLAEIGGGNTPNSTLLIGGIQNYVYPWDKTSVTFALPIVVAEPYIKNIVSVNQNAFIFPGLRQGRGRIYITNGSQADEWFKMPDYLFNVQDPYFEWGAAAFHRNMLVFGCFVESNASNTVLNFSQLWGIDLETKTLRSLVDINTATGQANATVLLGTGSVSTPGLGLILAWDDNGSAQGVGRTSTTAGVGTYILDTDLMNVGSFPMKKTFTQVEFKLRTALASGESITIYPWVDEAAQSSLSFQPTVTTGSISGIANVNWTGAQWLRFGVSATGNSATSGVRLREIRVR